MAAVERGLFAAREIRRAFDGFAPPPPDGIRYQEAGFPQYEDDEAHSVQTYFAGKDWRKLRYMDIRLGLKTPENAALGFMSPPAFRYFLPTFMLIGLEEYAISDVTAETAVYNLAPAPEELDDPHSRFRLRMTDAFTADHNRTIAGFLLAMQELHGHAFSQWRSPMEALQSYWAQFLPDHDKPLVGRVKGLNVTREDVLRVERDYYARQE